MTDKPKRNVLTSLSASFCFGLFFLLASGLVLAEENLLMRERCDAKGQLEKRWHVYVKDGKEIYHGLCILYWDNGNKQSECNMVDGKMSGELRRWYRDGQKLSVGSVRDGKTVGTLTMWYPSGDVRCVAKYEDGNTVSIDSYVPGGIRVATTTYKDGKPWDGQAVDDDDLDTTIKQVMDAVKAKQSKVSVTFKTKTFKAGQVVLVIPYTCEIPLSH